MMPWSASCSPRWAMGRAISQSSEVHTCLGYFEQALDLDSRVGRQRGNADRRARVLAVVAEYRDHQIGGAVHHFRAVDETGDRIDEGAEPHHPRHLVEIAERGLDLGDQADGAGARRLLAVLDRDAGAELSLGDELAVTVEANLAGDREHV